MKGDFSRKLFDQKDNLAGVYQQQGRVLLDQDWNLDADIANDWRDQAGRDAFGPWTAAIPAEEPEGFKINMAAHDAHGHVVIHVAPGRAWVNGHLCRIGERLDENGQPLPWHAEYLGEPFQQPDKYEGPVEEGTRDAVVLEVYREMVSAFQTPDTLLEPALGGVDTARALRTSYAFKLLRLEPGDTCRTTGQRLRETLIPRGKLKASLRPTIEIPDECPVAEAGGYTGFEHNMYRIEIAHVRDKQPACFKWSQFNGGLVGRGIFDFSTMTHTVKVTANQQAIWSSRLSSFYLEVVQWDKECGRWRVTYGTRATVSGSDQLTLDSASVYGEDFPAPTGSDEESMFFCLWNGIEKVSDYPIAPPGTEPEELRDGIRLEFDHPDDKLYQPNDYWTFDVRAGEPAAEAVLINHEEPEGVVYHRVPLAILNWNANAQASADQGEINDCRDIFRPLTTRQDCCVYSVGDGVATFGDFNSIQQAINNLPERGGEICLLQGIHEANVVIQSRTNIRIHGCDRCTLVIPDEDRRTDPIFTVIDSDRIRLANMQMLSFEGTAVSMHATEDGNLADIEIAYNGILAGNRAISVDGGMNINIHHNRIRQSDRPAADVAVYVSADDALIERNEIVVVPASDATRLDGSDDDSEPLPNPADPCAEWDKLYSDKPKVLLYVINAMAVMPAVEIPAAAAYGALGGILIAGGSERITIRRNKIIGGAGNGITLGGAPVKRDSMAAAPADNQPAADYILRSGESQLWGYVTHKNQPMPSIGFNLRRTTDSYSENVQTNDSGRFILRAAGDFTLSIITPEWEIESVEYTGSISKGIPAYAIEIKEKAVEAPAPTGFIWEVVIQDNEISLMGLSGIGLPPIAAARGVIAPMPGTGLSAANIVAALFTLIGNPVVDLRIERNRIFKCAQAPLTEATLQLTQKIGIGGISLGICHEVIIFGNRIENNGLNHVYPYCGIFTGYAENVDICHNDIQCNGPLTPGVGGERKPGIRGGIHIRASSFQLLDMLSANEQLRSKGRPAVRVHDNVVDQPIGRALTILAFGPASIVNNRLNTELNGSESLDQLAGSVLIMNLGGWQIPKTTVAVKDEKVDDSTPENVDALNTRRYTAANVHATNMNDFQRPSTTLTALPTGQVLFTGNQVRLGPVSTSLISITILSLDDLGIIGNQSEALGRGFSLSDEYGFVVNSLIVAPTLRASNNRFKEGIDVDRFLKWSLFSLSTLRNSTTYNHGDHCIIARNSDPALDADRTGNQELNTIFCPEVKKYFVARSYTTNMTIIGG